MKVVAIGGSPRLEGNSSFLIDQVLAELGSRGIETEKIILNEYSIRPCQAHENCRQSAECLVQDDANWIIEKFSQADGVILATPVYFGSLSAQMKTFVDRNFFLFSHQISMQARCAILIASAGRGGAEEAAAEMRKLVRDLGDKVTTLCTYGRFPGDHVKDQPETIEKAREMGRQMAAMLTA